LKKSAARGKETKEEGGAEGIGAILRKEKRSALGFTKRR